MPATRIRELQPDAFAGFFKFCFERHPVEKCLSQFARRRNWKDFPKRRKRLTWKEYLDRGDFPVDANKYCDADGVVIVDQVYRYEELGSAMRDIAARLGVDDQPLDAREKSGFRFDLPSFAEVMANPAERTRIMDAFAPSLRVTPYARTL